MSTKKIQAQQVIEGEIVGNDEMSLDLLSYESLMLPVLSAAQFRILTQKVPPHAIGHNQSFIYPMSGWIKQVLFQAFGMDWDWQLLPIEGDKYYSLHSRVEGSNPQPTQYVAVLGQLTVRIRDAKHQIVATIVKQGAGSQTWRAKMEFGDCFKGAKTDALRNAAYDLGIAREMKWDEEKALTEYESEQKAILQRKQEEAQREIEQLNQVPTTLVELITKAQRVYNINAVQVCELLGVSNVNELKDFAAAWATLGATNGNANHH